MDRGSEKLFGKSVTLDKAALKSVAEISAKHGKILDWSIFGQPNPDGVGGSVVVSPKGIGTLIDELININGVRLRFDIFPYGQPPVIDQVMVKFGTGRLLDH